MTTSPPLLLAALTLLACACTPDDADTTDASTTTTTDDPDEPKDPIQLASECAPERCSWDLRCALETMLAGEPASFEFPVCYLGVETWELRVVAVGDGTVELVTHVDDHAGYQQDDITLCSQLDTARIEAALEDCEAGASCDPCMMYESNAFGLDCQELPWVICTLP